MGNKIRYIDSIKLRNTYKIYETTEGYVCESEGKNRERYSQLIYAQDVNTIYKLLRNRTITVREAYEEIDGNLIK